MTKRSQHWLDEPQARGRKRTIRNWMHYRAPQAVGKQVADDFDPWLDVKAKAKPSNGVIPSWTGNIDMAFASLDAPLQAFAGDTTDAKNSALWGVRRSDRPNSWVNWKAYGVVDSTPATINYDAAGNAIGATWKGLWPGADLEVRHCGHKVTKRIIIRERSAPTHYEFTLKLAGGHDAVQVGDTLSIRDAQGIERLRTMPPWAHDSATTSIEPDGHQYFPATLTRGKDVKGLACYAIDINPKDLERAILPMYVDPTTTIGPNAATCEDNYLNGVVAGNNNNYGGLTTMYVGNTNKYRGLLRVATADIPLGTINSATWAFYVVGAATYPRTWSAWAMMDASTWVEGTGAPAAENGSSCWNKMVYNTTNWPGSVGAGTSGTDFIADASPPGVSVTARDAWYSLTLKTSWFSGWKSGSMVNNGWTVRFAEDSYHQCCAQEYVVDAAKRWYVTIDYVLGGAAAMLARRIHE